MWAGHVTTVWLIANEFLLANRALERRHHDLDLERMMGVEPTPRVWKTPVLPLYYIRKIYDAVLNGNRPTVGLRLPCRGSIPGLHDHPTASIWSREVCPGLSRLTAWWLGRGITPHLPVFRRTLSDIKLLKPKMVRRAGVEPAVSCVSCK